MRGLIIGIAALCYAAAVLIAAAAAGLPAAHSTANVSRTVQPKAPVPLLPPDTPQAVVVTEAAPAPPTRTREAEVTSEEDPLLQLAQQSQQSGDLKKAEEMFLLLLRKDKYRVLAAQRLGKLYFDAGDYPRAGQMYRESARVLREAHKSAPAPLVP
ncbi:MAG: tetratricopeptide repeat protein [Candidatus Methylomirabilia bacterium]